MIVWWLLVAMVVPVLAQPRFEEDVDCVQPMEEGWCARVFRCTDDSTQETVRMYRLRRLPDYLPVDTSIVPVVRNVCHAHNLFLPSVHTDLENWCVFNAGLHGTKGRVPLGATLNKSLAKKWMWDDGTPTYVFSM